MITQRKEENTGHKLARSGIKEMKYKGNTMRNLEPETEIGKNEFLQT
jgi:hypothetical protein